MGNESDKKPPLTLNDPVDGATMRRIGEIQGRRFQLGDMLLDLEHEKVRLLVESRRLDDEKQRLFTNILTARGLAPGVPVEVDPQTGKISLVQVPGVHVSSEPQANGAPPPPAPPQAEAPQAPPA